MNIAGTQDQNRCKGNPFPPKGADQGQPAQPVDKAQDHAQDHAQQRRQAGSHDDDGVRPPLAAEVQDWRNFRGFRQDLEQQGWNVEALIRGEVPQPTVDARVWKCK